MEEEDSPRIKRKIQVTVNSKPALQRQAGSPEFPRVLRFICNDPDMTDSDSDGDADSERRCVKQYVQEVRFVERVQKGANDCGKKGKKRKQMEKKSLPEDGPKFRGVRKRPWGKYAVEIRDPMKKVRLWLGTFENPVEAAKVYDSAAIQFRGSKAITNFPNPASSPTSVLNGIPSGAATAKPEKTAATSSKRFSGKLQEIDEKFLDTGVGSSNGGLLPDFFGDFMNDMPQCSMFLDWGHAAGGGDFSDDFPACNEMPKYGEFLGFRASENPIIFKDKPLINVGSKSGAGSDEDFFDDITDLFTLEPPPSPLPFF